jgi:hypothetical protein
LTSPAKNSELSLITNAGLYNNSTKCNQEGFNAESGHQVLNIRKNPREENTSSDEQDLHLKRQRTTGAFSHAGLVRMRYCSFLWNTLHCMYHGALFFLCNGRSRITSSLSML